MQNATPTSFPVLTTPRLILRQPSEIDASVISALRSNEQVNQYIDRSKHTSIQEAKRFIVKVNNGVKEGKSLYWVMSLKNSLKLIGTICLWNFSADRTVAEVGYELDPAFHGQGYMSEALQCIVAYGFDVLHLSTIEAFTHRDNIASIQLLTKHGFRLEADRSDADNEHNAIYTLQAMISK
jgi:ribosomal-protein-alanine N-acetyltransferase